MTILFLDPAYFEEDEAIRTVTRPVRYRQTPVITNGLHRCANFSHTISRLPDGTWQAWYIAATDPQTLNRYTAYSTSSNGLTSWTSPLQLPGTAGQEFSDILDGGVPGPERFKGFRRWDGPPPRWQGSMLVSPDGRAWTDKGPVTAEKYGETWQPYKVGFLYGLLHRWNIKDFEWTDKEGVHHKNTKLDPFVRCLGLTYSPLPTQFPASRLLFFPDNQDSGECQFYAASGIVRMGQYYVGLLHILRDDLKATGTKPGSYGMGYSVLIWSRYGLDWQRSREPFLAPNPAAGSWDHAVSWIDSIEPVGNEIRYYYGGYAEGHKVFNDRQIGVVKGKKDRLVAAAGRIRTYPFTNTARFLALNLDGEVLVEVLDGANRVLKTIGPIVANSVNRPAGLDLALYKGKTIKLQFTGRGLYAYRLYG